MKFTVLSLTLLACVGCAGLARRARLRGGAAGQQPPARMAARVRDRVLLRHVGKFVKDEQGKLTELVINQGGEEYRGRKIK